MCVRLKHLHTSAARIFNSVQLIQQKLPVQRNLWLTRLWPKHKEQSIHQSTAWINNNLSHYLIYQPHLIDCTFLHTLPGTPHSPALSTDSVYRYWLNCRYSRISSLISRFSGASEGRTSLGSSRARNTSARTRAFICPNTPRASRASRRAAVEPHPHYWQLEQLQQFQP